METIIRIRELNVNDVFIRQGRSLRVKAETDTDFVCIHHSSSQQYGNIGKRSSEYVLLVERNYAPSSRYVHAYRKVMSLISDDFFSVKNICSKLRVEHNSLRTHLAIIQKRHGLDKKIINGYMHYKLKEK